MCRLSFPFNVGLARSVRLFEYLMVFSLVNFDILVSRFCGHEAGVLLVDSFRNKSIVKCNFLQH